MTGGHAATTALATYEAVDKFKWEVCWIGSKRAIEGKRALTIEFKIFPEYDIKCYSLVAGRLQRKWTMFTLLSLFKIPVGFLHAFFLLINIRPRAVISFGGFVAFPVVVSAWILRIPIVLHEQTIAAGLANKYSSYFANKVAISRRESGSYFPAEKTVLTGNPVRKEFFSIERKQKIGSPPTIYATGGSRGSVKFNEYFFDIVPELVKEFFIIHQCGDLDLHRAQTLKDNLSEKYKRRYKVYDTIPPDKVPGIFRKADIVIGRSGANTVAEVLAAVRPAIFIPIPWSQHDEQTKNARLAVDTGIALIIKQGDLSQELLLETIYEVKKKWLKMINIKSEKIRELDKGAATKLVELAESISG